MVSNWFEFLQGKNGEKLFFLKMGLDLPKNRKDVTVFDLKPVLNQILIQK